MSGEKQCPRAEPFTCGGRLAWPAYFGAALAGVLAARRHNVPDESRDRQGERECQRLIEVIVGPCRREELDEAVLIVQETLDARLPELGAVTAGRYSVGADEPAGLEL